MLQHQRTLHRKELVIVNNRRHYTTGPWRKKDIVLTQIALGLFGIFMGVMIFAIMVLLWSPACAEELPTYKCWAFCEPGSEVLIRERPWKRAPVVGAAGSGEQLRTDWEENGNWIHLVDVSNETGEGWISKEYVVFDEPIWLNMDGVIRGKGRVACRRSIDGKLKRWAKPGQELTVYWFSQEWTLTDLGYIQSQYVGVQ